MINDPIADMLTRIRNAIPRRKKTVLIPSNKILIGIAKILKSEKFIEDFEINNTENKHELILKLKYVNNESAISHLERVSKPGLRIYIGYRDIPRIKNGLGVAILTTSKGILTDKQARQNKIGGELIAKIW